MGMRILGTQIDVALRGADCDARDRHALDQHERIAFHQHAVGERSRIAFVGIAGDVLLLRRLIEHRLPFDAGRKRGAAAAAQTGLRDRLDDLARAPS